MSLFFHLLPCWTAFISQVKTAYWKQDIFLPNFESFYLAPIFNLNYVLWSHSSSVVWKGVLLSSLRVCCSLGSQWDLLERGAPAWARARRSTSSGSTAQNDCQHAESSRSCSIIQAIDEFNFYLVSLLTSHSALTCSASAQIWPPGVNSYLGLLWPVIKWFLWPWNSEIPIVEISSQCVLYC